jgi:hypothetical protein
MKNAGNYKNFPLVLDTIELEQKEGVLGCSSAEEQLVQFFFRKGKLIYLCSEKQGQLSDEILHELLGWETFKMEWLALPVRISQSNVNEESLLALKDVLTILISNGKFSEIRGRKIPDDWFGVQARVGAVTKQVLFSNYEEEPGRPADLKVAASAPTLADLWLNNSDSLKPVPLETPKARPAFLVESNLLLPPGIRQDQLEDLLGTVSLKEQLTTLTRTGFTGYIYYQPEQLSNKGGFGLVIIVEGVVSDVVNYAGDDSPRISGNAALQAINQYKVTPQINKVALRILKAYRALINSEKSKTGIKLSKTAFVNAVAAFKQSNKDGLILVYVDKLKLHYFFLFEGGKQVGIFGPDFKSGHLQPLAAPLALPVEDANALMSVLVAGKVNKIEGQDKSNEPIVEPVVWNTVFVNYGQSSPATGQLRPPVTVDLAEEEDNPYAF